MTECPFWEVDSILILKGEVVGFRNVTCSELDKSASYHRLHSSNYKDVSPQSWRPEAHGGLLDLAPSEVSLPCV